MKEKIKVLLVDDHAVLREGIKTVLELKGGFEIIVTFDISFVVVSFISCEV